MSDTKSLDVTEQVTQALSDKEKAIEASKAEFPFDHNTIELANEVINGRHGSLDDPEKIAEVLNNWSRQDFQSGYLAGLTEGRKGKITHSCPSCAVEKEFTLDYAAGYYCGCTDDRDEVAKLRELLERAISAIKAKDQLLGCYRVGREPSTKLWGELEKVVHLLSEYAAMKEGKE